MPLINILNICKKININYKVTVAEWLARLTAV